MTDTRETTIDLTRPRQHHATIRSHAPLTVESSSRQWAYAVSVALSSPSPGGVQPPLKVVAEVSVESGELGCLLVDRDLKTLLGDMAPAVGAGSHTIELFLERGAEVVLLVFRNAGAGDRPCIFTVKSVVTSLDHGDRLRWSVGLADIMEGHPPRLSVERLQRAVLQRHDLLADDLSVFDQLRRIWSTFPPGRSGRRHTRDLLALSDEELRTFWLATHRGSTTGPGFPVRGWYQALYRDVLRGKNVLDVGSGFGIDGIEFARHGASMTFVDIVEDNLAVLERLCSIFSIKNARLLYLKQLSSLDSLEDDYDFIWCRDSQINVPFEFAKRECAILMEHLRSGGRWIELAYPRERWLRDGSPPFRIWGNMTDGEGTPWMEWYDLARLLKRLAPVNLVPVLALNFHDDDFNWFDLLKVE